MPANTGRSVAFAWDNAPVLGLREKGLSLNGEAIDITSDEDSGWRTTLAAAGQNEVNVSLSGVTKDRRLRDAWFSGNRTKVASLTYPDGSVISAQFYLASYSEGTPYNDAVSFDAEIQSTGVVTYTPGA
jgi:TP901-1 family phage major tail protein